MRELTVRGSWKHYARTFSVIKRLLEIFKMATLAFCISFFLRYSTRSSTCSKMELSENHLKDYRYEGLGLSELFRSFFAAENAKTVILNDSFALYRSRPAGLRRSSVRIGPSPSQWYNNIDCPLQR